MFRVLLFFGSFRLFCLYLLIFVGILCVFGILSRERKMRMNFSFFRLFLKVIFLYYLSYGIGCVVYVDTSIVVSWFVCLNLFMVRGLGEVDGFINFLEREMELGSIVITFWFFFL